MWVFAHAQGELSQVCKEEYSVCHAQSASWSFPLSSMAGPYVGTCLPTRRTQFLVQRAGPSLLLSELI